MANLAQLLENDGAHEFGHHQLEHMSVKRMHALQSFVKDLNLGKKNCHTFPSICEGSIEGKELRVAFPNDEERRENSLRI